MQEFLRWQRIVRMRFATGCSLFVAPDGKRHFFGLFIRNITLFILVFFYVTLFFVLPALVIGATMHTLPTVYVCISWTYSALLVLCICFAAPISVFDLPDCDRERAYLDALIPKLLPLPFANTLYTKTIGRLT